MGEGGEQKVKVEETHTTEDHMKWLKSVDPGWVGER